MLKKHVLRLNASVQQITRSITDVTPAQWSGLAMTVIGMANLYETTPTFFAKVIADNYPHLFWMYQLYMAGMVLCGYGLLIWPKAIFRSHFMLPLAIYPLLFIVSNSSIKGVAIYGLVYVLTLWSMRDDGHE